MNPKQKKRGVGFTLIELVMVILLLAILGAVAIPNFMDFRTDARNSATRGAVGGLRGALSIAVAAIQVKEDPASGAPKYPTLAEMQANKFLAASHPKLDGTYIMDPSAGVPKNPWTTSSATTAEHSKIQDCDTKAQGTLLAAPDDDRGWCYNATAGTIWANSDLNGEATTENNY